MSPVSLALDGLLIGLLIAALIYGIRLERKLKILREGQEKFAQTVRELNLAAGRAEAGLGALKSTAEEVGDTLHGRILAARELAARLETLVERGGIAAPRETPVAPATQPRSTAPVRPAISDDDIFVEEVGAQRRPTKSGDIR